MLFTLFRMNFAVVVREIAMLRRTYQSINHALLMFASWEFFLKSGSGSMLTDTFLKQGFNLPESNLVFWRVFQCTRIAEFWAASKLSNGHKILISIFHWLYLLFISIACNFIIVRYSSFKSRLYLVNKSFSFYNF